jgi:hypothetical protein
VFAANPENNLKIKVKKSYAEIKIDNWFSRVCSLAWFRSRRSIERSPDARGHGDAYGVV